jgi:hypothetical protein
MAAAAVLVARRPVEHGFKVKFTVTPSGSYGTGGDTLDLSGLNPAHDGQAPFEVRFRSVAGYVYAYVDGASDSVGKFQVFANTAGGSNLGLGEHTAAAYNAGVTGDTITGWAEWRVHP